MSSNVSLAEANRVENEFFEGKIPSPPLFIITYGPPGSGKSDILKTIVERFGLTDRNLVEVLVDDIVARLDGYREAIAGAVSVEDLEGIYFRFRADADAISESILNRALLGPYHVAWETTGHSIDWTVYTIDRVKRQGYRVVLVYPFVGAEDLVERVQARAARLRRTVDAERIVSNIVTAQRNFITLSGMVDEAIVYDNTGPVEELGYLVEFENRYIGYCRTARDHCLHGVETEARCDVRRLRARASLLEPVYAEFLLRLCDSGRPAGDASASDG